jgi:predicted ribosomally synthesized peptide with nif11-like leader
MSSTAAVAFLERVEQDQAFAAELESVRADPARVLAKVHVGGYDATEDEISHAFIDRYGTELTQTELGAIAAGWEIGDPVGIPAMSAAGIAAAAAA